MSEILHKTRLPWGCIYLYTIQTRVITYQSNSRLHSHKKYCYILVVQSPCLLCSVCLCHCSWLYIDGPENTMNCIQIQSLDSSPGLKSFCSKCHPARSLSYFLPKEISLFHTLHNLHCKTTDFEVCENRVLPRAVTTAGMSQEQKSRNIMKPN